MNDTAPLDTPFFRQLRQLGDDVFLSVVSRRAARGDRAAVANALEAISEGGRQELLWAKPTKITIPLTDAKGLISDGTLEQMSLLQAVALSLAQDTLTPDAEFSWTHLTSIEGSRKDGADARTNQWEWRDDRPELLHRAIELCAEQSRLLKSDLADHPVGLLFDALVARVDFRKAFDQFAEQAPLATTFTIDLVSSDSATSLVRRGNLHGARLAIEMIPAESKQLDHLLRWLHTDADKGSSIFNGLLSQAHAERKNDPQHDGMLDGEHQVVDLVRRLINRQPQHAGDVLLRVCTGSLQISEAQRTPPSSFMIEALLQEHERRHKIEPGQPWSFEPPPASQSEIGYSDRHHRPRGITQSQQIRSLIELAIDQLCVPVMERLCEHLQRYSSATSYSEAWSKLRAEVPVNINQFERTSELLFQAGVPKGVIELPPTGRGKKQLSSALHLVAQSGHPQAMDLMVSLLNLGCDPMVSDNQRRKPGSYLDEEVRKRWEDIARSARAREAAMSVLREEFSPVRSVQ